jgi:hypothetical protein
MDLGVCSTSLGTNVSRSQSIGYLLHLLRSGAAKMEYSLVRVNAYPGPRNPTFPRTPKAQLVPRHLVPELKFGSDNCNDGAIKD